MLWGARTSGYCQNTGAGPSHWRDRHFDDTPCLSRLKHLIQVQGGCHQMTVPPTVRRGTAALRPESGNARSSERRVAWELLGGRPRWV